MYMVMLVFSGNDGCYRVSFWCCRLGAAIMELCTLLLETSLDSCGVSVMVFTVFDTGHAVLVLFW